MKLDRKGFTLIELLVTIVIIGLVVGFSTYGIIMVVNNSKEKVNVINENNIKEAARIYSNEASSNSWKKADDYDNFCVTVGELMNKGLLDKNAKINETEIERSTYVIVKRNKVTMAVENEEIVSNTIGDKNNEICTGQTVGEGEDVTAPTIDGSSSYTDKIVVSFTPGSATYQGSSSATSYKCLYGETSSYTNREGKVEENSCIIDNLKSNHDYYIVIYMNTDHGSSVAAVGNNNYKTTDLNKPSISYNKNIATITYNDKDTKGNSVNNPSHYFKSNVSGTSNESVETCQLNNEVFTCNGSTTNISSDTWYKVSSNEIKITYPEEDSVVTITSSIHDGSNNSSSSEKEFIIRKYTIKFYKGSADSIDGSTDAYITKSCIVSGDEGSNANCSITSPSITRSGYTIVGWNTSSSATSSSWNVSTAKNVSASATYYAITKKDIKITFNANGATIGATSGSCTIWNNATSCSVTSPSITRSGYTIVGWNTSSSATSSSWNVSTAKDISDSATYYAITKPKVLKVTFYKNDGSDSSVSQEFTYGASNNKFGYNNDGTPKWGTSGQFGSWDRTGYELLGWSTTSTATSATYSVYSGVTDSWINSKSPSITLYAVWKDKASPTCKLSATAGSTTITAKASDNSGSFNYYGWSSSYSGSNSTSKTVNGIGIIRYYVKDTAGNTGSCSAAITGTAKNCSSGYTLDSNGANCYKTSNASCKGWTYVWSCARQGVSGSQEITTTTNKNPYPDHCGLKGSYCNSYTCPSGGTLENKLCYFYESYSTSCSSGYTKLSDSYCYSSNNNSNIDTSATYVLRSYKNSNYVMDVENMGKENESNVLLWSYNGGTNQQWKFQKTSSGYYNILAKDSGRCLDIYQGDLSVEDGKNIQIYDCGTGAHQQWLAVYNSDGSYTFKSAASSTFSLDITGEIMEDGTNIEMYTSNNTNAQKWTLEKIG